MTRHEFQVSIENIKLQISTADTLLRTGSIDIDKYEGLIKAITRQFNILENKVFEMKGIGKAWKHLS